MSYNSLFDRLSPGYFIHPTTVCMSYWQHFQFSFGLGMKFAVGSFQAFVHAIYPDAFITSSGDLIKNISNEMKEIGCKEE